MDDQSLVAEFLQTRRTEVFGQLVERHQANVFRLVASILGPYSDADAEEVAQEAFLDAFRNLAKYRAEARFSTWLYRVAANCALDRRARARFRLPHVGDAVLERMAEEGGSPFEAAAARQVRERVARVLEELPDQARTLLYLRYWMDCGVAEIAELLGMNEGTVKSYLARARKVFEERYAG